MITKQEVKHIAKLARLSTTEKEEKEFQKELSSILDYIKRLKEVDISNIEPMSHPVLVENVVREDKPHPSDPETQKKLLELAPKTKNRYLKVKSIF